MFGKKKQVAVATQSAPVEVERTPIRTVDIIGNSNISYIDLLNKERTEEEEHLKHYLYILERKSQDDTSPLDMRFIDKARKAGFNLFVRPDVVSQFKNAALVFTSYSTQQISTDDGKGITYTGDIPDFALDRIMKAQNAALGHLLTIHSNQELAVKYESYVYRDPVIISWNSMTQMRKIKGIWQCTSDWTNIGFVVAMWGEDGQPL